MLFCKTLTHLKFCPTVKKKDCPKSVHRKYDVLAVCQWILANLGGKSTAPAKATQILEFFNGTGSELKKKKSTSNVQSKKNTDFSSVEGDLILNDEKGIFAALQRLQTMEVFLSQKFQTAIIDSPETAGTYFKSWESAVSRLESLELQALKVLKEREELVPIDAIQEKWAQMIAPVKTKILALPVDIAPNLANRDRVAVQEELKEYCDKLLLDCSEAFR